MPRDITAAQLEGRLAEFTPDRLSVPWESGPPYALPPEVDVERTMFFTFSTDRTFGGIERINRRVHGDAELRDPATRVMWASAPADDFQRTLSIAGEDVDYHMGDVMGTMTSIANRELLHSYSPNYGAEFLEANLPRSRGVRFVSPNTLADFERALLEHRPDLLCLSGLNVNTNVLLRMALFAKKHGVKELWIGAEAAIGPYKIIDEAFDRAFFGLGEEYFYRRLVGDDFPGLAHPPAERMLAKVKWLALGDGGRLERVEFNTLHLALRLGCTQTCVYCAERQKSGGIRPPTAKEQLDRVIDDAAELGIRKAYFVDPDFGRIWGSELERCVEKLHSRNMRWSCLTNIRTLREHGEHLVARGLSSVYLGIESLAPSHKNLRGKQTLSILNRGWQDQNDTAGVIRWLADNGVFVLGLYILANPGESLDDGRRGVDRYLELPVPISQFSTNQPFPGTAEFVQAVEKGWIHSFDPDCVIYGRSVWAPNGERLPPADVEALFLETHKRFNDLHRPGGFVDHLRRKERARAPKQRLEHAAPLDLVHTP